MFCENCGKRLIRGYQFCLECGTPVPPQSDEEEAVQEQAADSSAMPAAENAGMPQVGGFDSEKGTLVFCPNCGMHMQKSGAYCDKCGMQLQSGADDKYNNLPKNGDVPLWNTEREDYGYANMSDSDIEQINKFMSGGGISADEDYSASTESDDFSDVSSDDAAAEIEQITNQFASMYQPTTNTEMPAIGAGTKENSAGERMVDNFAMESTDTDNAYIENGHLPVIEGASMEFDPTEPEPEDPNAFVMTDEPIEDITPTYSDVFTEAKEEVPAYEEPAAAVPAYEEPVAAVPAYEEPVAAVPVYEEPATEIADYSEPEEIQPAEEAPAFAVPVYTEDGEAAEESYIYSADEYNTSADSDIPLFEEEPADYEKSEEATAIFSDYAQTAEAVEDTTAYAAESSMPELSAYTPSAQSDYAPISEPESAPVSEYSEAEPVYNQPVAPVSAGDSYAYGGTVKTADDFSGGFMGSAAESAPAAEAKPSDNLDAEPEIDLGRLVYCRNCGQDMYEKELVCRNCGAPKRPEYQRPSERKQKKESKPFKLFGIFSVPALIGVAVAIALVCALIIPSMLSSRDKITTSKPESSTTSSTTTMNVGGSEPEDTTAFDADVTEPDESKPDEPVQTSASTTASTSESTRPTQLSSAASSTSKPASSTSKPASSSSTATSTSKPATTTTAKPSAATTTTAAPAVSAGYSSSTVIAQNKERDALISAYETIAGELGKVDAFARSAVYAIMFDSRAADTAGKSFYSGTFGSAALKSIKSGKSAVSSAVSAAKPSTSELNKAYNALRKLQGLYEDYYDYVVNATSFSQFESKCDSYLSSFTSCAKSDFSFSVLNTSAQTNSDRAQYYADVIGDAANAADNAANAYTTLNSAISKLTESSFSGKFLDTLGKNISTYMNAAKYTRAARAYYDILVSSSYAANSCAYLGNAAGYLLDTADVFYLAAYDNTLSNFKSTVSTYTASAKNASANAR